MNPQLNLNLCVIDSLKSFYNGKYEINGIFFITKNILILVIYESQDKMLGNVYFSKAQKLSKPTAFKSTFLIKSTYPFFKYSKLQLLNKVNGHFVLHNSMK